MNNPTYPLGYINPTNGTRPTMSQDRANAIAFYSGCRDMRTQYQLAQLQRRQLAQLAANRNQAPMVHRQPAHLRCPYVRGQGQRDPYAAPPGQIGSPCSDNKVTLQTSCSVIGIVGVVIGAINLISEFQTMEHKNLISISGNNDNLLIAAVTVCRPLNYFLMILINAMLFKAAGLRNQRLCKAWIVATTLNITALILGCLLLLSENVVFDNSIRADLFLVCLQMFFIAIVGRFVKDLGREERFRGIQALDQENQPPRLRQPQQKVMMAQQNFQPSMQNPTGPFASGNGITGSEYLSNDDDEPPPPPYPGLPTYEDLFKEESKEPKQDKKPSDSVV